MSDRLLTRRDLMKRAAATGAAISLAPLVAGCGNNVSAAPVLVQTIADAATFTGIVTVPLGQLPDLQPIGGALIVQLENLPSVYDKTLPGGQLLIVHRSKGDSLPDFIAVDASCPHAGCPLGYSAVDGLIECPCHGSRFLAVANPDDPSSCIGKVTHQPAAANLQAFPVSNEGDTLVIDLRKQTFCNANILPAPDPATLLVTFPLSMFPALAAPNGSIVALIPGVQDQVMLLHPSDMVVVAVSAVCTHVGCVVNFVAKNADLECPCHNSTYALDGKLTKPADGTPAGTTQADLRKYKCMLDVTGTVVIDLNP